MSMINPNDNSADRGKVDSDNQNNVVEDTAETASGSEISVPHEPKKGRNIADKLRNLFANNKHKRNISVHNGEEGSSDRQELLSGAKKRPNMKEMLGKAGKNIKGKLSNLQSKLTKTNTRGNGYIPLEEMGDDYDTESIMTGFTEIEDSDRIEDFIEGSSDSYLDELGRNDEFDGSNSKLQFWERDNSQPQKKNIKKKISDFSNNIGQKIREAKERHTNKKLAIKHKKMMDKQTLEAEQGTEGANQYKNAGLADKIKRDIKQSNANIKEKFDRVGDKIRQSNANIKEKFDRVGDKIRQSNANIKEKLGQVGDKIRQNNANIKEKFDRVGDKIRQNNASIRERLDQVGDRMKHDNFAIKEKLAQVGDKVARGFGADKREGDPRSKFYNPDDGNSGSETMEELDPILDKYERGISSQEDSQIRHSDVNTVGSDSELPYDPELILGRLRSTVRSTVHRAREKEKSVGGSSTKFKLLSPKELKQKFEAFFKRVKERLTIRKNRSRANSNDSQQLDMLVRGLVALLDAEKHGTSTIVHAEPLARGVEKLLVGVIMSRNHPDQIDKALEEGYRSAVEDSSSPLGEDEPPQFTPPPPPLPGGRS